MADMQAWFDDKQSKAEAAQIGPWIVDADFKGANWLVCSTGNASDGEDYHVTTDGLHASESNGADAADDARHIAAWSPDTALRVLRALRAAIELSAHAVDMGDHDYIKSGFVARLDDALKALPGARP